MSPSKRLDPDFAEPKDGSSYAPGIEAIQAAASSRKAGNEQ